MGNLKMNAQQATTQRHIHQYAFICTGLLFVLITLLTITESVVYANDVKPADRLTIVTPGIEARLCPQPGCGPGQHITRIPQGTILTIQNTEIFEIGTFKVKWFAVVYQNQPGWVSIYDTDQAKK